ncbi:DUF3347 domain-containing protein [Christiangramia sp.]|uniref:DUF3347 domain-containing protein n=1 Tax=Christiangramia sp. TaxID=1931228 RepID=UPI002623D075|nr:DUF3347 domain-containing protein [Christiangramia sp.]
MKNFKAIVLVLTVAGLSLNFTSCKENNNEEGQDQMEMEENKMNHKGMDHDEAMKQQDHDANSKAMATNVEFEDEKTRDIFQHYIHVKTALVNADVSEAQKGGKMLMDAFGKEKAEAQSLARQIQQSDNIEEQRKSFSLLTVEMEDVLKGSLSSGEVYKQYCPMAFNNQGAYWISKDKEIRNPYFGDKMLKCGSTKEVIQ